MPPIDQTAAERMNRIYRHQRHVYDATRRLLLPGRRALIDDLLPPAGGCVLEVGCGTAWMLLRIARRYPEVRLFGLDVSAQMLATARQKVARAGFAERIRLAEADAAEFDAAELFGHAAFDRVVISYALSMMPDWQRALDAAACVLGPGGSMHIVDFGTLEAAPALARRLRDGVLARFTVRPRADLEQVVRVLGERYALRVEVTQRLGGYAQLARLTRAG
jgi:S-adenosylmethionine-diacylgycerolhomoserine-N-methlytransferase